MRQAGLRGKGEVKRPPELQEIFHHFTSQVGPVKPKVDYYSQVPSWVMALNDTQPDCVVAMVVHADQGTYAEVAQPFTVPPDPVILKVFDDLGGTPTSGLSIYDVLVQWNNEGLFGEKIAGFAPVDHTQMSKIKLAIDLFGGLAAGVDLPADAESQFNAGTPWELTGDPEQDKGVGGHAVWLAGYDDKYIYGVTWANVQRITWEWWFSCGKELWAVITPAFVAAKRGPEVDLVQMQSNIAAANANLFNGSRFWLTSWAEAVAQYFDRWWHRWFANVRQLA